MRTHAAHAPRRGWRLGVAVLIVAWAGALAARWIAVGTLLPHDPEMHERVFVRQLERVDGMPAHTGVDPDAGYYPDLVPQLAHVCAPGASVHAADAGSEGAAARAERVARLRRVCALISATVVPAAFLIALRLAGMLAACCAALLTASSLMLTAFGWQARPHGTGAALMLIAIAALLEAERRRRPAWSALAGVATGLALANLQSAIFLLPALPIAHVAWWRVERGRASFACALALAATAVIAVGFQPDGSVADPSIPNTFAAGSPYFEFAGHAIRLDAWHGSGFVVLALTAWSYDPVLSVLALAGCVWAVARAVSRRAHGDVVCAPGVWTVLGFAVPYTLVVGAYDVSYPRFALPLIPLAAVLAACALARCATAAWNLALARCAFAVCAALVLAAPAFVASRYVRAQAAPDTETEVAEWLATRAVSVTVLPGVHLPRIGALRPGDTGADAVRLECITMDDLLRARTAPQAWVDELSTEYVVVSIWNLPMERGRKRVVDRVRDELGRQGARVACRVPWSDGTTLLPYLYDNPCSDAAGPWWRSALRARCAGPALEIYRLERPHASTSSAEAIGGR
jgi:hypothetical protein